MASTSPPPSIEALKAILRLPLRISTTDGRVFIGTFVGVDKPLNILLVDADEYHVEPDVNSDGPRYVGHILVPWKMVVKVEVQDKAAPASVPKSGYF